VPGCFATAAILALAPLLRSGLAEPSDIVIVATSGISGAGRAPKPHLHGAEVMGAVSAYQVGGVHRHTPEIEQALTETLREVLAAQRPAPDASVTVSFTPSLAPMPRGILATCTARLTGRAAGTAGGANAGAVTALLRGALADAYADEPFVHLMADGVWPSTAATIGSNAVHLQAAADIRAGRAVVVAAIDNLGKGAAGQAIQNANLMTGLQETAGLTPHGVSP
jgi:N-acetyl-gamma-glutamyl-phosphate reductase